ncbi:MAG TPA: hypothetical protein VIP11_07045 [Gemmatimonadaceae bacterium]
MRSLSRLLAAAALAVLTVPAGAQTRAKWSVQGSALFAGLGGGAYSGIDPGAGFELQVRARITPTWSLGCGFQGTYHSLTSFIGDVKLQGLFCEPRKLIDIQSDKIFPYVSARGAVLRQNLTSGPVSSSADGGTINVGAGVMIPFGPATSKFPTVLELGGSAGYTSFGDYSSVTGGQASTGPTGGGYNFVLRAGIAVGLPTG